MTDSLRIPALVIALSALAQPAAHAQTIKPRPYTAPSVSYDRSLDKDASLRAFLGQLKQAAHIGDLATIDRLTADNVRVWRYGIPIQGPKTGQLNVHKPKASAGGPAAMRDALWTGGDLSLNGPEFATKMLAKNYLQSVQVILSHDTVGPNAMLGNDVCAPAHPVFSREAVRKVAKSLGTPHHDALLTINTVPLYAKPTTSEPPIDTLPPNKVVFMHRGGAPDPANRMTPMLHPNGSAGYADISLFLQTLNNYLCFGKNAAGDWRITGAGGLIDSP